MIFKSGVELKIQPFMASALPSIDLAHHDVEIDRLAVVTSANDSKHMLGSLHYTGLAVDLRTRDLAEPVILRLTAALRRRLNGDENKNHPFQIVKEVDHVHVEYQPK